METLKTVEEIAEKVAIGLALVIFTKQGCPNCLKTEASALELVQKNPDVKVYKVECVQEQNAMNETFLPRRNFIYPVVHSFENGNHVYGSTGLRSTEELATAWIPIQQRKIAYFDMVETDRRKHEYFRKQITEVVAINDVVSTKKTAAPEPIQDPQDSSCDSCQ